MLAYTPQDSFLALLMTGDGKAIGNKFGIAFSGRWVWNLKNYIDTSFMRLFDPNFLFQDYPKLGTAVPLESKGLFEDESGEEKAVTAKVRQQIDRLDALAAARLLQADEEQEDFMEQLIVIDRMGKDEAFCRDVVELYKKRQMKASA